MLKRNLKAKICSLCFNTKCDVDFEVVEVIKEVLEIVLPKLNLEEGDKHLICGSCSVKLFAAFNFKSVCTDTEDIIFPFVNSQEIPLTDLREIYLMKEGDIKSIDILENQKICRLCFQPVGYGFVSLNEVNVDIIDNYIPEVNFNATKDPVICKVCSESLVTHGTFLRSCLAAQEENRKVCGDPAEDREYCINTEKIKTEDDWERNVRGDPTEDRECCIKTEEIEIEEDEESYPPTILENVETIKNIDGRFSSENKPVEYKKCLLGKVQTYMCNRCDFKTVHKYSLKNHCMTHVSLPKTYVSPKSRYESESRDPLLLSPLKPPERMYQCEKCPYRTHYKRAIIGHWSTHEVPPKMKMYQCEKCHYRVRREDYFRHHLLRHEDSAETIGNFKGRLGAENVPVKENKIHTRKRDFQTRYKKNLLRHELEHEKTVWKDVKCYTTADKEIIYKCNVCIFKTNDKYHFQIHRLYHAQPKFKCHTCVYESDDKEKLTRHQAKHSSGVETLNCDLCSYQTMWKSNFVRHQLRHKKACEVKTYDCDKCSFRSIYKVNVKRHMSKHVVQ